MSLATAEQQRPQAIGLEVHGVGDITKLGLSYFLVESARQQARAGDHPDYISIQPPFCYRIDIAASLAVYDAMICDERQGSDRHPIMETVPRGIASGTTDPEAGPLFANTCPRQRAANRHARGLFKSIDPAELGEALVHSVRASATEPISLEQAIARVLKPALHTSLLNDQSVANGEKIHKDARARRSVALMGAFIRDGKLKDSYWRLADLYLNKLRPIGIDAYQATADQIDQFDTADVLGIRAAGSAITTAAYWATVHSLRDKANTNFNPNYYALESLRYGGALAVSIPREQPDSSNITMISQLLVGRDPNVAGQNPYDFDPSRFNDPSVAAEVRKVAFGKGAHRCPSDTFSEELLTQYCEQLVRTPDLSTDEQPPFTRSGGILSNAYLPPRSRQARVRAER